MDHQEQHHEKHRKERDQHKHEHQLHEQHVMSEPRKFHRMWFVVLGAILIGAVVLVWTFAL